MTNPIAQPNANGNLGEGIILLKQLLPYAKELNETQIKPLEIIEQDYITIGIKLNELCEDVIHIPIQELVFDGVSYSSNSPSASRFVSMNTEARRRPKI